MSQQVAVGVVGLGRSGWRNHVGAIRALPDLFRLVAVAEPDAERRHEAERDTGCRAYANLDSLLRDANVELVVVATPTHLHAAHAVEALEAGKSVVCEKPMALDLHEADAMLAAARRTGRILTVFHNYRFQSEFTQVRAVIESGVLGRVLTVKLAAHRFARRDDWQALRRLGGGVLRNTAWHLIDQALVLIAPGGEQPRVLAHVAHALAAGDAEDYVKVVLKVPGVAVADIEVSDVCAFPQSEWTVMGTCGTLDGGAGELAWRFVQENDLPPLEVNEGAAPGRAYRFHELPYREQRWHAQRRAASPARRYYESLHATIRSGAPLAVTPESARRVMWVVDECFRCGA